MILSIFCKIIKDFPSIFLPKDARQRSARQRQNLKRSARRLACLALKARDTRDVSRYISNSVSVSRYAVSRVTLPKSMFFLHYLDQICCKQKERSALYTPKPQKFPPAASLHFDRFMKCSVSLVSRYISDRALVSHYGVSRFLKRSRKLWVPSVSKYNEIPRDGCYTFLESVRL